GVAGLGRRTGSVQRLALGRRPQRHQLQHRAQLWSGDRRRHCRLSGSHRCLRDECAILSPFDRRTASVAAYEGAGSVAAGTIGSCGRLWRSLHPAFAIHPHRPWTDVDHRDRRRLGFGADAACHARPAAPWRGKLWRHAWVIRSGRCHRRPECRHLRSRLGAEDAIRLCLIVMAAGVAVVALSRSSLLTSVALVFAGAGWTSSVTLFNVGVQLAAPRWVAGRALAAYQAAISGGIAVGAWIW